MSVLGINLKREEEEERERERDLICLHPPHVHVKNEQRARIAVSGLQGLKNGRDRIVVFFRLA